MRKFIQLLCIASLACLVGCGDNNNNNTGGGAPSILSVTPNAVSIGQKNGEGVISGTNLNGVTFVGLGDGVAVDSFTSKSATEIDFTFTVAGNISGGPKTVTVTTATGTVTNPSVFQVLNNHAPKALFTVDPPVGSLSTTLTFDASSSTDSDGNISSYQWDFGDGKTEKGKKVTHKYATVGKYAATLKVVDSQQGYGVSSRQIEVSKNTPPVARWKVDPGVEGTTGTVFSFDGSSSSDSDGKVKDWLWEFGDGGKVRGKAVVEHQFKNAGTYAFSLTVFDNLGAESAPNVGKIKVLEGPKEVNCTHGTGQHGLIFGRVVGVESGNWAVTAFGSGRSCANTFHKCDDYRRAEPENFYGIVDQMKDRGNGILSVHNKCPHRWPPAIGEKVFLIYKTCSQNHCP